MNLYLYIPPHSAHSPGVLYSIIFGHIYCVFHLCSDQANQKSHIQCVTTFFRKIPQRQISCFQKYIISATKLVAATIQQQSIRKHQSTNISSNPPQPTRDLQ